ncbi:MAG: Flp pilus assembly complex ATPase component TadA [Treponema sp.]|uniref:ATPase, T2SS/T4P/T4SS family n=1 Tax=Treponema sp. TaxID=166 RepID=UPI0025FB9B9F|nr:ATPase, T2SS/T4P/T4SS family [Treponema sp.]MBQ9282262.1 Flp pilus assembly complex ATPase component TadA [Treponema sp.]
MASLDGFGQQVKTAKWIQNLLYDMDRIIPYLENPFVTDIAIGKAGELIVEGIGMEKNFTGIFFSDAETTSIINTSAAILGVNIDPNNPTVEGVIPLPKKKDEVTSSDEFWNIRVEGILPPRAVGNPMYFIRRPSDKVFPLQSYLESNRITKEKYDLLVEHIKKRSNIVIGGETGSGKTSLQKSIINEMVIYTPNDRFYIVEDANEIQCNARDLVPIWAAGKDCLKAVAIALRCNVSRIIFGELRYGDVTNELLKAWNSGHTGGITTVHANSALTMISRIRDLLREVIPGELPDVSQSVQLLVHMIPTKNGPIVNEVVETKQLSSSSFIEDLENNNLI